MAVSNIFKLGFLIFHICFTAGEKCKNSKPEENSYDSSPEYTCPREDEPEIYTECCRDGGCCERSTNLFQIDEQMMMITAVAVIILCLILMALVVICCFWSKCPFYNTCGVNYNSSDVIVYSSPKEDDPLNLMPEEEINSKGYTPLNVKIKRVEEV